MSRRARRDKKLRKRKAASTGEPSAGKAPQASKALIQRIGGDAMAINHSDNGAPPMKLRVLKYQKRGHNGFGSHLNGRHKQG